MILHDAARHGCGHYDVVNRIEIPLKTRRYTIPPSRNVVAHTSEDFLVRDVALCVAEVIIAKLTVHAVANIIKLFV